MKVMIKKIISIVLVLAFAFCSLPAAQASAQAAEPDFYTLKNNYISVNVSGKNGGFSVVAEEGNRLIKSDNNKRLLYHNGEYDTSFTSFQVTYPGGRTEEYVFGGNYTFLGLGSNQITTTQDATGITSKWTVDKLTFTQRIELANAGSAEHGMVSVSYKVSSAGSDTVSVKQRLLLDTALGDQDFAYYEVIDINNNNRQIKNEQVIASTDFIPLNFFGYDDPNAPGLTAYTVNNANSLPYQVAFAHWNNLAATAFDFVPDSTMTYTNQDNLKYQTADSAYALYYDMGAVPAGGSGKQIVTNYGVYSNVSVPAASSIAVNVSAPLSLTLSPDKTNYVKTEDSLPGKATFSVQAQLENFLSEAVKAYDKVTVAFYTSNGITPLDGAGNDVIPAPTYLTPYTVDFMDFGVGGSNTATFYFKADVGENASYRKVEMNVFDTGKGSVGSESSLTKENLIGSSTFYILCPGGNGNLPRITFTGNKPDVLYYEGTRHLYITGNNIGLLNGDKSQYSLIAYNRANSAVKYTINSNNILFPEENVLDIIFTEAMAPGIYDLKFELTDNFAQTLGTGKVIASPALTVAMSDDIKYRNNYYGIVAVVQQGVNNNAEYLIKSYKNEVEFNQDKSKYHEVLLVFRGEFIEKEDPNNLDKRYVAASVKTTDSSGNDTVTNMVTLNNCIDFENGTLSVYYNYVDGKPNSVYVDFDGSLFTSVERSSIWKGKAALTEIKNGFDYGLMPYNKSGTKMTGLAESPITLIWPNALGIGQTLSGMVFKMTYGTLGTMYDTSSANKADINGSTPVLGNVLSFSAVLDLGFLIPQSKTAKANSGRATHFGTELYWISEDPKDELRGLWDHYINQSKTNKSHIGKEYTQGQGSVLVDNILFGCGKGFIGISFAVDVALPAYIDAMPSIVGKLAVNTINNWSFGVSGKCEFATITIDVDLGIKSQNNVPIPDKLYLYVAGFEPGINIDGFGVLWITGGGGGIDKLYDTIFSANGVPPLKLLLSVAFDVFKVLSARADLSLSLRGIGLSVNGVKIKGTGIDIIKSMKLQFDWYPDIYLLASVSASYFDILTGQGYIVVIDNDEYNGFFEGFLRATLKVPGAFPLIGGMELARLEFGLNNYKIWGAACALGFVHLSVVYYWGADIDVSLGKNPNAQPTFPELLGMDNIPVYYDEETGRTLYMSIGDNLKIAAMSEITENFEATPRLLANLPSVYSNAEKERHILNAGTYSGTNYAYTISFDAESLEDARTIAAGFTIRDGLNNDFDMEMYSEAANNVNTANANVTFDDRAKKGTLGIVLSNSGDFDKDWEITTTGVAADIILLEIGRLPEVSTLNHAVSGQNIDVGWDGEQLDQLDSLSFYLTTDPDGEDAGQLIAALDAAADITGKNTRLAIPADLPSGNYYLRAVYSQESVVNGVITADSAITYTNSNQPVDPGAVVIANTGDLTFNVDIENDVKADGYLVNIYEKTGGNLAATDVVNMTFDKVEDVLPEITVGGSYQGFDTDGKPKVYGLTAGKSYQAGVKAYKYIDEDSDGVDDYVIYGNEVLSNVEILKAVTTPEVEISAQTPYKTIVDREWGLDQNGSAAEINVVTETFGTTGIEFLATSDCNISGKWYVDDFDYSGDFSNTNSFSIALAGLGEGTHTLNVSGKDADGDGFRVTKVFEVDTLAPKLLLSSPINGSFFSEDGILKISGITDKDAVFTIAVDGITRVNKNAISELSGSISPDGLFDFNINVDPGVSSHNVTITVSDKAGNDCTTEAEVMNSGLGKIKSISIYANGIQYTNKNLTLNYSGSTTAQLSLTASTQNSSFAINDYDLVSWDAAAVKGSASVSDSGVLTVAANSIGYVTGGLRVAEKASMTASATFGADVYGKPISDYHTLTLGSGIGGEVSGSGNYAAGAEVAITAKPSANYRFKGWRVIGGTAVTITDPDSVQTTIIMPDSDIHIVAEFGYINETGNASGSETAFVNAKAGEKTSIPLASGMNKNRTVVCVLIDGVEHVVAMSAESNGNMYFIAPVDGKYYLKEIDAEFTDIAKHWAKDYIEFAYARNLFKGIGGKLFDPDGEMTRAMFVTVLGRLWGVNTEDYSGVSFIDVTAGEWYAPFVEWASRKNIVSGYGNGTFGTNDKITREQMCVILERYIRFAGNALSEENPEVAFKDGKSISSWAEAAVKYAQMTGLVQGTGNNLFNPSGEATRAEVATIFCRLISKIFKDK